MEYVVGAVLAILISLGATAVGLDRDRAMYPLVIVVIALLYALFAVIGGSREALLWESIPIVLFVLGAVLGFRISLWWAVLGLAAHGMFDLFHADLIHNPGVPPWWPMFCASYDLVAAAYLAGLLGSARLAAAHSSPSSDRVGTRGRSPITP